MTENRNKFGTAPVFLPPYPQFLAPYYSLRFGFAVGTLGFIGVMLAIIIGHIVTIPTALAISEIATNKRVRKGRRIFHDFAIVRAQHWRHDRSSLVFVAIHQRGILRSPLPKHSNSYSTTYGRPTILPCSPGRSSIPNCYCFRC